MRAAGILADKMGDHTEAIKDVARFVEERWRGVRPVAWGESLVEAQFTQWFYDGICGLGDFIEKEK
jgi:glycerol-3-phosphate dehydrogenase